MMREISPAELKRLVQDVLVEMQKNSLPVGISNRHIHLTEEHFSKLFPAETMEPLKPLKQPGEFASKQTLTLKGPKGKIERVRVLGPLRKRSQVELAKTDARTLGIEAPIRLSGDLDDAALVTLESAASSLTIPAAIVAKRHIHMSLKDSKRLGLVKGDIVSVEIGEGKRRMILHDVEIRPGENYIFEMHVDTDEANAADLTPQSTGRIIR